MRKSISERKFLSPKVVGIGADVSMKDAKDLNFLTTYEELKKDYTKNQKYLDAHKAAYEALVKLNEKRKQKLNYFDNEEMCRKLVVNLNNAFNKYNFSFKKEYRIINIGGFSFPNDFIKAKEFNNYQIIKTTFIKFSSKEYSRKKLNFNGILFNLKYKFSDPGYKMINNAIRYINSKCNFYNSLLYTKHLKQDYKDLSKRELRNWLKANLVIVKISNNIIENFSNNNKIYDNFEYDKDDTKSGNSHIYLFKIEFTFNKVLLDINKYIYENNISIKIT